MRIFPLVLITVGVFGLLRHFGWIDPAVVQLLWPLLLIGIGVAMLVRGPRWRADMRERMGERWERKMHRRFGPGWANLSDDERERFRAGMRQWHGHGHRAGSGESSESGATPATPAAPPPAPGAER